jgi:hypothetical protein
MVPCTPNPRPGASSTHPFLLRPATAAKPGKRHFDDGAAARGAGRGGTRPPRAVRPITAALALGPPARPGLASPGRLILRQQTGRTHGQQRSASTGRVFGAPDVVGPTAGRFAGACLARRPSGGSLGDSGLVVKGGRRVASVVRTTSSHRSHRFEQPIAGTMLPRARVADPTPGVATALMDPTGAFAPITRARTRPVPAPRDAPTAPRCARPSARIGGRCGP